MCLEFFARRKKKHLFCIKIICKQRVTPVLFARIKVQRVSVSVILFPLLEVLFRTRATENALAALVAAVSSDPLSCFTNTAWLDRSVDKPLVCG